MTAPPLSNRRHLCPTVPARCPSMPKAVFLLSPEAHELVYPEPVMARLRPRLDKLQVFCPPESWTKQPEALAEAEVIFSGWGAPRMDEAFLRHVPRLRALFYAGGSVRYFLTEAFWARGIRVTTAQAINAVPVAEFTAASLVLGLKRVWHYARLVRETGSFPRERPMPGAFGTTVGLVSYGIIARQVRARLRSLEVDVIVYDPYLSEGEAAAEGVRKVSLDELFATAHAVSLHTPHLTETEGMVRGRHFELMRPGGFFLNTARGEVVAEAEMIEVLRRRPDLQAQLDVTFPEPPRPDSPLYQLPNVALTPHLAGSMGKECQRMGLAMAEELARYVAGAPLHYEITAERAAKIA